MIVNGKEYPMWSQFVERKDEWIGGKLQELSDSYPRVSDDESSETTITDIRLEPSGNDSAYFSVDGLDYGCGGDVHYLGVTAGEEGWITLSGYGGHTWRIKQPEKK
ncbi:MAG: hypothetical protein PHT07_14865 [Paludibacter sp.]|nr:hypothetical protein [Paludibacter sp.]